MNWLRFNPSSWPITLKAPLLVAVFMIATSVLVSQQVLTRLVSIQEKHLAELSGAYLDGLTSSIMPHVLRQDVWEVFDAIERTSSQYSGLKLVQTVVLGADGRVLAASDPHLFPTASPLASNHIAAQAETKPLSMHSETARAHVVRDLTYQNRPIGRVYASLDVSKLLSERSNVFLTLVMTNLFLTLLLGAGGYWAVRRIVAPVRTLDRYLSRGVSGAVEPVPEPAIGPPHTEFGRLFRRYNGMVRAVNERQELANRLAEEEKIASLGRLTSGIAHEINNPLAGMMNAVDTLKRHGDQPRVHDTSLRLIERGLSGIRDVVRAALATYKHDQAQRVLTANDLDDLRILVQPKLRGQKTQLIWENELPQSEEINLPGDAVRQIALNLLLNASAAAGDDGRVEFRVEAHAEYLTMTVADSGAGLADAYSDFLTSEHEPMTPLRNGSGIGLWMVRRLTDEIDGRINVKTDPLDGTRITVSIPIQQSVVRDAA